MKKNIQNNFLDKLRTLVLLIMVGFTTYSSVYAQADSKGTDFWLMFPTNYSGSGSLKLFITAGVNTSGTVSGPSFSSIPFTVTANTVTTVTLPSSLDNHTNDVADNNGIHVTSLADVSVYGLNQIQYTTDAYLGLPTDALGTDYRILSYTNASYGGNGSQLAVVGTQNSTTVTITPTSTTGSRTAGVPYSISLNQGQSYQLQNTTGNADLTGSVITSDKPIGVYGAVNCANIPVGYSACDHIVEMMPPTTSWGTRFGTVPLATRINGDTWRILAKDNSTTVTVNGSTVATLSAGQYYEAVITNASIIEANKAVLVAQYSNGQGWDGIISDPFMMLIPPLEQFQNSYTLTTPASGFSGNYTNLIVPNSVISTITQDGSPIGAGSFTAIGASGFSSGQIAVSSGAHNFSSSLPFGAFQYGFGSYDSYGYPGGGSYTPVATVNSLALTPSGTSAVNTNHCFTATVLDQFSQPVVGVKVDFDITGPNSGSSGFAYTDSNGVATFCYSGPNAGTDSIYAHVGAIGATVTWVWTAVNENPCTDTINPTITCPTAPHATANNAGGAVVYFHALAHDNLPGVVVTYNHNPGTVFPIGVTNVTATATDACGNIATCNFDVTVTLCGD